MSRQSQSRVLYVDDDQTLCRAFARFFAANAAVTVTTAHSSGMAVQLLQNTTFDVVVSDLHMPGMDGIELLSFAHHVQPLARRLLVSGGLDLGAVTQAVNRARIDRVLTKPWRTGELADAIQASCARASAAHEESLQVSGLRARLEEARLEVRGRDRMLLSRTSELLEGFLSALDLREPGARNRARRLARYTRRLGRELGIRGQELEDIEYGVLLHDIGKVGLPDALLKTEAQLSQAEWVELMHHPVQGHALLERIPFLERSRPIVLQHHELHDGSGYPAGLAGDEICVGARIYAVCATFDKVADDRAHEPSVHEAAMWEVQRRAGSWLDPTLAGAWLRVQDDELNPPSASPRSDHKPHSVMPVTHC